MSRPKGVKANLQNRIVQITWSDGHISHYPFDGLRAVCPCVECRGGHVYMGHLPNPETVRSTAKSDLNLEQVEAVGAYALQFVWSDGHSSGIYTWKLLRAACPCSVCLPTDNE